MADVPVPSNSKTDDVNITQQDLAELTTTLDDSLYSKKNDEIRSVLYAEDTNDDPAVLNIDGSGNLQVDATLSASDVGILDSGDNSIDPMNQDALQAVQQDQIRVDIEGLNREGLAHKNKSTVTYGDQSVSSPGTPEALNGGAGVGVADGLSVLLKAHVASPSSDQVYVHDASGSGTSGFPLDDGESLSLAVDDVAAIHVDADTVGDGVDWIVEQ